jgi:hypothetical protein
MSEDHTHFALEFYFLLILRKRRVSNLYQNQKVKTTYAIRRIPLRQACLTPVHPLEGKASSISPEPVTHWRFCTSMNERTIPLFISPAVCRIEEAA